MTGQVGLGDLVGPLVSGVIALWPQVGGIDQAQVVGFRHLRLAVINAYSKQTAIDRHVDKHHGELGVSAADR
jgi:hypothetical protein